jgi:hypothetical protein
MMAFPPLPCTGQIYLIGNEYAKQLCLKAGIAVTFLDNASGSAGDLAAVQRAGPTACRSRMPTDMAPRNESSSLHPRMSDRAIGHAAAAASRRPGHGLRLVLQQRAVIGVCVI